MDPDSSGERSSPTYTSLSHDTERCLKTKTTNLLLNKAAIGVKSDCSMLNEPLYTRPRLACPEERRVQWSCLRKASATEGSEVERHVRHLRKRRCTNTFFWT